MQQRPQHVPKEPPIQMAKFTDLDTDSLEHYKLWSESSTTSNLTYMDYLVMVLVDKFQDGRIPLDFFVSLCKMFCIDLVVYQGGVFSAYSFKEPLIDKLLKAGGTISEAEKEFNSRSISEMFRLSPRTTVRNLKFVGRVFEFALDSWLRFQFPKRRFMVEYNVREVPNEGASVHITFYQLIVPMDAKATDDRPLFPQVNEAALLQLTSLRTMKDRFSKHIVGVLSSVATDYFSRNSHSAATRTGSDLKRVPIDLVIACCKMVCIDVKEYRGGIFLAHIEDADVDQMLDCGVAVPEIEKFLNCLSMFDLLQPSPKGFSFQNMIYIIRVFEFLWKEWLQYCYPDKNFVFRCNTDEKLGEAGATITFYQRPTAQTIQEK